MVQVCVALKNTGEHRAAYVGSVTCVGLLNVLPDWPESDIEKLVFINGTGMLYSSIREMICNITSRGPHFMLTLPSQSFVEMYQSRKTTTSEAVSLGSAVVA